MGQRGLANRGAVALKVASLHFHPSGFSADGGATVGGQAPRETHRAHGLGWAAACGSGNTSDGKRHLGLRFFQSTQHHGLRHCFTDRTVLLDQRMGNAQHLLLGFVAVADKATLKPLTGTGKVGASCSDHAAGATFCCAEHPTAAQQTRGQGCDVGLWAHWVACHKAKVKSVQNAATTSSNMMPKPPRQPCP